MSGRAVIAGSSRLVPRVVTTPTPGYEVFFTETKAESHAVASAKEALIQETRNRADKWAKGITTFGTTALTALGITNLVQIFPSPYYSFWFWVAVAMVVVCLASSSLAVAYVGGRLSSVSNPLVMRASIVAMTLSDSEKTLVRAIYGRQARANGFATLAGYASQVLVIESTRTKIALGELHAHSDDDTRNAFGRAVTSAIDTAFFPQGVQAELQVDPDLKSARVLVVEEVERLSPKNVKRLIARVLQDEHRYALMSDMITADVAAARQMALDAIVRERMAKATASGKTMAALAVIVTGVLAAFMFAGMARAESGGSKTRFDERKACIDLAVTLAEKKIPYALPEGCPKPVPTVGRPSASTPTPGPVPPALQGKADAMTALAAAYVTCLGDAKQPDKGVCEAIARQQGLVADLPAG